MSNIPGNAGFLFFCSVALLFLTGVCLVADLVVDSWQSAAPRDEIRPHLSFDPKGGRASTAALDIETDDREGLSGSWFKVLPVQGARTIASPRTGSWKVSPTRAATWWPGSFGRMKKEGRYL